MLFIILKWPLPNRLSWIGNLQGFPGLFRTGFGFLAPSSISSGEANLAVLQTRCCDMDGDHAYDVLLQRVESRRLPSEASWLGSLVCATGYWAWP